MKKKIKLFYRKLFNPELREGDRVRILHSEYFGEQVKEGRILTVVKVLKRNGKTYGYFCGNKTYPEGLFFKRKDLELVI